MIGLSRASSRAAKSCASTQAWSSSTDLRAAARSVTSVRRPRTSAAEKTPRRSSWADVSGPSARRASRSIDACRSRSRARSSWAARPACLAARTSSVERRDRPFASCQTLGRITARVVRNPSRKKAGIVSDQTRLDGQRSFTTHRSHRGRRARHTRRPCQMRRCGNQRPVLTWNETPAGPVRS